MFNIAFIIYINVLFYNINRNNNNYIFHTCNFLEINSFFDLTSVSLPINVISGKSIGFRGSILMYIDKDGVK